MLSASRSHEGVAFQIEDLFVPPLHARLLAVTDCLTSHDENSMPTFFYDGECGICDVTVAFLLRHSDVGQLRFVPLQSEVGKDMLAQHGVVDPDMKAAYFYREGRVVARSDAIAGALRCCRFPASGLAVFRVIPRWIRDACYRFVARNRYRISFLSKPKCRILSPTERGRFLQWQ